jgi:heptosyltransferase-2
MKKILVIGPAWVGDTMMSQCLFKLLKQQDPTCLIDVVAPAWTFSLLSCMPEVRRTIEMPVSHGVLGLGQRRAIGEVLRAQQYDLAIVLPHSFKSALVPWFARIPVRRGWRGEYRYGLLNDLRKLDKKRYPLMIEQYMALALSPDEALPKPYPVPTLTVSPAVADATRLKHQPLWRGKPIMALCPGAEYGPAKRWPEEYYAKVAQQMIQRGWDVWLFGSSKDRPVAERVMQLIPDQCENLTGRLVLPETVALLSLVNGVVTNDSGLLHVACALKKPVIALYGPTSPDFTPPLFHSATVLRTQLACQPCFKRECPLKHHHCMRQLSPEQVLSITETWSMICEFS